MHESISVSLPTGRLDVSVRRADLPLDVLCGFGARRNPRRGFLFVSKVLGRHLPVRPSTMRDVHRRLARKLPDDLPGPVVVLGLAETAIALGRGVFEEYVRATGREDVLFLQSTRYHLSRPVAFRFSEEHSHASAHLVYRPEDARADGLMRAARSLVVVDDEASTGRTFANIVTAFRRELPALEHVAFAVITDWRPVASPRVALPEGLRSHDISLLEGEYAFTPADRPPIAMPRAEGSGELKDALISRNDGRFGLLAGKAAGSLPDVSLPGGKGRRVLVLGTGEFVYPPYLLAAELEQAGAQVWCQATTRSPALVGDAIGCALQFHDNYADGIDNYVYNVRPGDYDDVIICYETPADTVQPELIRALGARVVSFS
ncbi:phosphoribosyltransferase family protein [Archangium gephyra]|uniref:phosphoribosyltransferase domain-containing protein n=1 Tax=Archangium gephyra TaxID=48 RepID=UPI0035D50B57